MRSPPRARPPPRPARAPRACSRAAARARAAPRARGRDALVPSMLRKPSVRADVGHVQKWSSGRRLGMPMLRGRQECPADDPEPQRTPAAPHRPPASAQCRTCTGPCTLAGGSSRAREGCRACLARPDASRRALSFAVRTVCRRDRSRERQARMCAAALLAPFQQQVHAQLAHRTWRTNMAGGRETRGGAASAARAAGTEVVVRSCGAPRASRRIADVRGSCRRTDPRNSDDGGVEANDTTPASPS